MLFKYEKVSEMKSTEVSDILAPKCSSTSNVSLSKEVSETAVKLIVQHVLVNSCPVHVSIIVS